MTVVEGIEQSLGVLRGEIERLESLGLTFAASLVRIAEVELQMRLYNISNEEIEILSFAASAMELERRAKENNK